MQYLIIKCEALNDQFECDAKRIPIRVTEEIHEYGYGYEIWRIEENGELTLYKEYEEPLESGMALYKWEDEDDIDSEEPSQPIVIRRYPNKNRDAFSRSFCKNLKKEIGFKDTTEEIYSDIQCSGCHGEIINNEWVVFGEYTDDHYSLGY